MKHDEFDKMMGYAMHDVKKLSDQLKHINRNRLIELNQRDLLQNGIEND